MSEGGLDDWVVDSDIPTIADRIKVIRAGDSEGGLDPQPAAAMRILHTFAKRRRTEDLLNLQPETGGAGGFTPLDAQAVVTLAALTRDVEEAATLAIKQWEIEQREIKQREMTAEQGATVSGLASSIVHDVTAQRTVREVAVFIRECQRKEATGLVSLILKAFVKSTSGRTNLDKAFLYIALRGEGCASEADELLGLALGPADDEAPSASAADSLDRVGFVSALRHLSPSEMIVERWIEREMSVPERELNPVTLVSGLLTDEPDEGKRLAKHAGDQWGARRLIDLCKILASSSSPHLTLVRGYAAARQDMAFLAELIPLWSEAEALAGTLRDLLADIIAGGQDHSADPRSIGFLNGLQRKLENDSAPDKCRREMRVAVAAHVYGRSGAEIALLLGKVGRRDLRRAAQGVNERLTARLLAGKAEAAVFVDYVIGLQKLPEASSLTFWALRELSDPTASDHALEGAASIVGDIAGLLYAKKRADTGFDLLERCLENEQWLEPDDAANIVERLRSGKIPKDEQMPEDERWTPLLSATMGRWADTRRREKVVEALLKRSLDKDAAAVIRSVQ